MLSADARPENFGRRRSLALGRSEHDGRLMGVRDGVARAAVPTFIALLVGCMIVAALPAASNAGDRDIGMSQDRAAAASSSQDRAPTHSSAGASMVDPYASHIAEASQRFGIPARWIRAVMAVESTGDPAALSGKGAIGLMQIMPGTWDELREKHGLGADPWQPRDNIMAGAAYLREMYDRYRTVVGMLAAYNAGPARYEDYLATGRALPAETVAYVAKIAPMVDGSATIGRPTGARPIRSWSRAPLFAGRPDVPKQDDVPPPDFLSGYPSNRRSVVDIPALAPPSDGLFVPRPAAEGARR